MVKQYKWWILLAVVVLIIGWTVQTRNGFIAQVEGIDGSWAQVENQMQRRYDLIPNLVNTVKGIAKQEQTVFLGIAEARAKMAGAKTQSDKIQASGQMESALSRLLVVVEQYPQLKSSENFSRLMDELAGSENRLSVERKRYNDIVQAFNRSIRLFPKNLVAKYLLHLEKKDYFKIEEQAKATPKVEF
jgi:LemA protein